MYFLLYICCIFSEQLFIRTPLTGCYCVLLLPLFLFLAFSCSNLISIFCKILYNSNRVFDFVCLVRFVCFCSVCLCVDKSWWTHLMDRRFPVCCTSIMLFDNGFFLLLLECLGYQYRRNLLFVVGLWISLLWTVSLPGVIVF